MAASVALFQSTPSLKKAAGLINNLNSEKLSKVLQRIIQKLHNKMGPVFTSEESERLQVTLELDAQDLELVIDTSVFVYQQAAYHLAKPPVLQRQLQDIGLAEDKAGLYSQLWSTSAKSVVEKLRTKQFYPKQLEGTKWRLNLQMAQDDCSRLCKPNAMFELSLSTSEEDIKEKIKLEFSHKELYHFYEKLEAVQEQLDSLA